MTTPRVSIDQLRAQLPARERRTIRGATELRAAADAPPKIAMRIPFGTRSEDMGFTETIDPGCFDKTLEGSDVVALWNHDPSWVLGRESNRSLSISKNDQGLEGVVTLDQANQMHVGYFAPSVQRGDVVGSSFGFETVRDEWAYADDGSATRKLLEVRLYDLSPVTFPAYPDSEAEARALRETRAAAIAAAQGIDPVELQAVLTNLENGHVAAKHVGSVRRWMAALERLLPPPATPSVGLRRRRLELLARDLELPAARSADVSTGSWTKPTLEDFYPGKTWDQLTADEKHHVGTHYAWAPADAATFGDLKLPYKEPKTGKINIDAVRNALARLDQAQGIPAAEKDKIRAKLEGILEAHKAAA